MSAKFPPMGGGAGSFLAYSLIIACNNARLWHSHSEKILVDVITYTYTFLGAKMFRICSMTMFRICSMTYLLFIVFINRTNLECLFVCLFVFVFCCCFFFVVFFLFFFLLLLFFVFFLDRWSLFKGGF